MLAAAACLALAAPAAAQEPDLEAAGLDVPAAQLAPAEPGYAGPPPSDGPPVAGPVLPPPDAAEVLAEAEDALSGDEPGAHITLALQDLSELLPALSGPQRQAGEQLLARPTQRGRDPFNDGYTRPFRSVATKHFCIFWVSKGRDAVPALNSDGDRYPDYVEAMASFAETSYRKEHGKLGWRVPPRDGRRGCRRGRRSRTDIYAKDLPGDYGYAVTDSRQRSRRQFAYLVVDNDMKEISGYPSPLMPLAVTIAHEYNHVVQFGYDTWQSDWMYEGTATTLEEQVFPLVNDYLNYLPEVARRVRVPLTLADGSLKIYGDAVFNHFLMRRLGRRVLPRAWALSVPTRPTGYSLAAYNRSIARSSRGRSSFLAEFVRFAAALPEWRGSALFPDSRFYPTVARTAKLRTSARRPRRYRLDHTTYRLFDVRASGSRVRLVLRAPRRIQSGLALVGRKPDGEVVKKIRVLRRGGRGVVVMPRPGRFERLTAVIVNGHSGQRGYNRRVFDWRYTGDNKLYVTRVLRG